MKLRSSGVQSSAWIYRRHHRAWLVSKSVRLHPSTPLRFIFPVVHQLSPIEAWKAGYDWWRRCTGLVWPNRSVIVGTVSNVPMCEIFSSGRGATIQAVIAMDSDATMLGSTITVDVTGSDLDAETLDLWWPAP